MKTDMRTVPCGRQAIPRCRRLVVDVLRLHRRVATCAHDCCFDLGTLDRVRESLPVRISWPVLFIKAWAAICTRHPQLIQMWRSWPWEHVYQHAAPVATVAVTRSFRDADWLFWGRIRSPHFLSLTALQRELDRFVNGPVEQVFRQQLQLSALPASLRRLIWWWNLELSGRRQAKRTGTFLLTTLAGRRTEIQHPPGFLTTNLTYGPLDEAGRARVTIAYDHRLMDGAFVADRLIELERELNGAILGELLALSTAGGGRSAA